MSKQDKSVQFATVQVERSYDMRTAALLHFNTARKDGKDLDDALYAAWRAMLSKSASPEQNDFDALRAENERLRLDNLSKNGSIKAFGEQIAALQRAVKNRDKLKARAEQERDQLRSELTEQGLMVVSESRRALRAERERDQLRAELAALKAVQPVADEREAFENWADQQWPGARRQQLERSEFGRYKNPIYQELWAGWQARAALSAPAAGQDVVIKMVMALKDIESASCTDSRSVLIAREALAAHKAGEVKQ